MYLPPFNNPLESSRISDLNSFIKYRDEGVDKPAGNRRLHITRAALETLCNTFKISPYFIETVVRINQLGRMGFMSNLHPGVDGRPAIFGPFLLVFHPSIP